MNKGIFKFGALILIIILLVICLGNRELNYFNEFPYNYEGYRDSEFCNDHTAFIFKYPKNWIVKEIQISKSSQAHEIDLGLGGVELYLDANSERPILQIYRNADHFYGVYNRNFEQVDSIVVNNEKIADIWMEKENEAYIKICATYRDTFEGANLFLEKDIFNNYKEEIFTILSSIRFYNIY